MSDNKYQELDEKTANTKINEVLLWWNCFVESESPRLKNGNGYYIHKRNLFEVIKRCDKREYYYKVFHDLEKMCELKKVAILAYWINTLKPFMVVDEKAAIYNCPNELFSIYLIISVIRRTYMEVNPEKEFIYPTPKRIQEIAYDFKYCNITRQAMIAFVETFADNYGVGIGYILSNNDSTCNKNSNEDD